MSGDSTCQYLVAVQEFGNLYLSSDFGGSWSVPSAFGTSGYWTALDMSSSGQFVLCAISGVGVYVSSDFGMTWTKSTLDAAVSVLSIAVDSSGQNMILASASQIYLSSDLGMTWAPVRGFSSSISWSTVAVDVTGQYQYAGSQFSGL